LKKAITYKDILRLSLPIIAGSAIENLTFLFNTLFLGRVGAVALGAIALGGLFYLAFIMLGFGFGIGAQIIMARRYGEKNLSEIGRTLFHAAIFLLIIGCLFIVTYQLFGKQIFRHIVTSKAVCESVIGFLSYRIWGLLFAYINILFRSFYTGIMRTKVIGVYSGIVTITNIFFDYSLIFGNFGFPKMGIEGAGLASVIAEIAATLFFIIFTISRKNIGEFHITKYFKFDFNLLGRILKTASPVMLQFSLSFGTWFLFFLMVEKMGEIPLAVSHLLRTFYLVTMLPIWGFASATNTLVSFKIGSGQTHEIGSIVKKVLSLALITVSILVLMLDIFSKHYFGIFTNNQVLIDACIPVLKVVSTSSILVTLGVILYNVVSGSGRTIVTLTIETIVITFYMLWTYCVVYIFHGSIAMVWIAEVLYGLIIAILASIYLKYGNWRNAKV
jgi:putative MATE family efflux protein